jgi:hypothetical protein
MSLYTSWAQKNMRSDSLKITLRLLTPLLSALTSGVMAKSNEETMGTNSSKCAGQLASDRTIGDIEPVFEFYEAMPTSVTVSQDERIFVILR